MARPTPPGPTGPRPYCYACDKPASMCLCGRVAPIHNRTGVHVLQHHRERRHAIGTVRLLRLGLDNLHVHTLHTKGSSAACPPVDLPPDAALLYPSERAVDLADLAPADRPSDIVVIDGTWSHAHRIHRDNAWVNGLPHVRLSPSEGSRYRIRVEPRRECLSTAEAVVATLELLEPGIANTTQLLDAFGQMIDDQIAARHGASHFGRRRPRVRAPQAIPGALRRPAGQVVVAYAEAAPDPASWHDAYEPVRLSAVTADGDRVFDGLVATRSPLDAYLLERLGLDASDLSRTSSPDAVRAAFRTFCDDGRTTVATWSPWTHKLLGTWMPEAEPILLKTIWASLSRTRVPGLEQLVSQLELEVAPTPVAGRAGGRLSAALAMAQHIRAVAP